jgi:hypothetical protein
MKRMRTAGRVSALGLGIGLMVALFAAAFVFAKEGPENKAVKFMDALARHDVDKLVEYSYIGKTEPTEIETRKKHLREEWDFAVNTAGKHYYFVWRATATVKASDTHASVTLQVNRTPLGGGGSEEKFELPMELEGGNWKVDVGGISSEMFPALPR